VDVNGGDRQPEPWPIPADEHREELDALDEPATEPVGCRKISDQPPGVMIEVAAILRRGRARRLAGMPPSPEPD
jgi:hypothetical protein